MNEPTESLPPGWTAFPIEELFQPLADGRTLHHGWSPQCDKDPAADGEWGVLKTTAVQDGAYLSEHNKRLPTKLKPRAHFEVKQGDLLITCAGPRVRCGVPCLVRETRDRLILSGKMYRFRVLPEVIDSRYMEAYLRSPETQRLIDKMKTGISDSGLNLTHGRFFTLQVPVAPPAEQRRIVAKIEELLSDLDAGVAALTRVKANLKRYRASVLKAAIEGRLTAAWRKRNPATEPAVELLERILSEYRSKWEQNPLLKRAGVGKASRRGSRGAYSSAALPVGQALAVTPKEWTWASAEQLCGAITKGTTPPQDDLLDGAGDIPFIKIYNLTRTGRLDFDKKPTFISRETHGRGVMVRSRVLPGDVLMNIVGPPLGKVSVVPELFPEWNVNQAIAILRPLRGVLSSYLACALLTPSVLVRATSRAKATAGQHNLTLEIVRELPVPLPPTSEQAQIVAEVDRRLSVADAAETQIEHALQRAARLRQAILKRAFEGKLVLQDPTDEHEAAMPSRSGTIQSKPTPEARRVVRRGRGKNVTA